MKSLYEQITTVKNQLPPGARITKIFMNDEGERLLNEWVATIPLRPVENPLFITTPLFQGIPLIKNVNQQCHFKIAYEIDDLKWLDDNERRLG